jgi:dynein heavy chain
MDIVEVDESVRNEFVSNVQKFLSQISHAIQQVTGNIQLPLPDIEIDPNNLQAAADDPSIVTVLEGALDEWINIISQVIEAENRKMDQENRADTSGRSPLSFIEFWRDRNAALSALYEQVRMEYVQNLIAVMDKARVNSMNSFRKKFKELLKLYTEAKDNVRFLTTLERHFKNISNGKLSTSTIG